MTAAVLRADARALPLSDASVDLVVTSPPYFALRDYRDGDDSLAGQIGAEPTPAEYVAALLECTREWARVLKPSGSLWINLGDKYVGGGQGGNVGGNLDNPNNRVNATAARRIPQGTRVKSLLGLPWRYALGCIDLGLILRAEVIWAKPNGLPESVTDRVRRSHEHWFHLTKRERYYSQVDEIREPHVKGWTPGRCGGHTAAVAGTGSQYDGLSASAPHSLGALPGSVWTVATQPLIVPDHIAHARCCDGRKRDGCEDGLNHYAAFPPALPLRIIAGWSPPGICTACGQGRRPVTDVRKTHAPRPSKVTALTNAHGADGREGARPPSIARITGYACACPEPTAPTRPALVVDPFGGTGTTALAARALGRNAISVDLSHDYARLAQWRTQDPGELARVLGKPKPAAPVTGQLGLELEATP